MSILFTITAAPEDVEAHMPRVRFEAQDVELPGKRNPGPVWFAAAAAIVACAGMLFAGLWSTADAETRFGWHVQTDTHLAAAATPRG